jgi:probable rRNA maturation factor
MPSTIFLEIQHETGFSPLPSDKAIQQWAEAALKGRVAENTELCIRLVDKPEIQTLNQTYRHKDKPTNVLSFPVDLPEELNLPLLGDIVICPPVVFEEAEQQGKPYDHHFAHMIIHGCLHLLGYDHLTEAQANLMEPLEIQILHTLTIPNPYTRNQSA